MARGGQVQITINYGAVNSLLSEVTSGGAQRAGKRAVARARQNLKAAGRHRTGALSASITAKVKIKTMTSCTMYVGTPLPYGMFQEKGIGPVHARAGGVLAFQPKGSSVTIFRPRTRGFTGAHYLSRAAKSVTVRDFLP